MSTWRRFVALFGAKAHAAMDRFEDPRETLDLAYREQLAAVAQARRGIADVLTSEKRLELEAESLRAAAERFLAAASVAAGAADEVTARRALEREAAVLDQRARLRAEVDQVRVQREALEALVERMQRRLERFRTEKLALGARYAVAKATSLAGESATGLSPEMEDVSAMVERAQDKARDAQARAAALLQLADAADDRGTGRVDEARIDARLAALKTGGPAQLSD